MRRPPPRERGEGLPFRGNREVPPPNLRRRGRVGETWFPSRERAEGERRSRLGSLVELRVEPDVLVVEPERVPELVALRLEVARVLGVRRHLDRHLLHDLEAEALYPGDLARVVRENADRRQPELREDLRADPVVARVRREAELDVCLDGVASLLLQLVRLQLVQQADPAAL